MRERTRQGERERGQAYVLEGVIAALVIAAALVLGMQVVDIAPWTGDESRALDDIGTQAEDVLEIAHDDGTLHEVARCIIPDDPQEGDPLADREAGDPGLLAPGVAPDVGFEELLDDTLEGTVQYAIELDYPGEDGTETASLTTREPPQRSSTAASKRVTLFESDPILEGADCRPGAHVLEDVDDGDAQFYLENQVEDSELYGVVTIRVIVW